MPVVAVALLARDHDPAAPTRLDRFGSGWRALAMLVGIAALLTGSVRGVDDWWPFGPMSQYAMHVPRDTRVDFIRIEATTAGGEVVDVPLNIGGVGVARAEIEARIPQIVANPALLQQVADGWAAKHPDRPGYVSLRLFRDTTTVVAGRVLGPPASTQLAAWTVR